MNYQFPTIRSLEDILPAIDGRPEFAVMDRGYFLVVNYHVVYDDSFPLVETEWDAIRRECRGLIFDRDTKKLIARRYHKFFNLNERPETLADSIDWNRPHIIMSKLDGSMVSPVPWKDKILWTTKMGVTEVASQAEAYVKKNPEYLRFAKDFLYQKMTPIFEWCSNKSRVVIDYPHDHLYLTGIRDLETGQYVHFDDLLDIARPYDIEVCPTLGENTGKDFIGNINDLEGHEGIVIRFDDGHMLKVKTEWYVLRHKSKEAILREKNVLQIIFNDEVDDVLPFLVESDRMRLIKYRDAVNKAVNRWITKYSEIFADIYADCNGDRKEFAIRYDSVDGYPHIRPIFFGLWDGGTSTRKWIEQIIKSNLNTRRNIDIVRYLWDYLDWEKF